MFYTVKEIQEHLKKQQKEKEKGLTTKQWALKHWLEYNFIPGKWFTIEEVVEGFYFNWSQAYKLNTNQRYHDKCRELAYDINQINRNEVDGYKIIVKNEEGSIKLAENKKEVEKYCADNMIPLFKMLSKYYAILRKAKLDGTMALWTKYMKDIADEDRRFIEAYMSLDDSEFNVNIKN